MKKKFKLNIWLAFAFIILLNSCNEKENMKVQNYYSAGAISSSVISYTPYKVKIRLRFFIYDKTNNDGTARIDPNGRISYSGVYMGTYDSLKRVITDVNGNFSAAVIISSGKDIQINMRDFFEILEPTTRKICHSSLPANEILLVQAGNKSEPVKFIGGGFTRNPYTLDQDIAAICKTGNYVATDSLCLLKAIDSVFNYMISNSSYTNRNCIIMVSRREYFWNDLNTTAITNKAIQNGIRCHLIDICPAYTWENTTIYKFLSKLNARTNGIYYSSPFSYIYYFEDSELPMDMLQLAANVPSIFYGGAECFEMIWTIESSSAKFFTGNVYEDEFMLRLNTNSEQDEIRVNFRFYI